MRIAFFGAHGKVGTALLPALAAAGHEPVARDLRRDHEPLRGFDAAVDFTAPEAVATNVRTALEQEVPCVVGTTGWEPEPLGELAAERGLQLFVAPNFALGAILMMRFAEAAGRHFPRAEIVELHAETKRDTPSGTAKATAARLPAEAAIHSVRLPGLVAHQEVLFGGPGQLLTIRHDTLSRDAFAPGVLLALERLPQLSPGLTVGLEALLDH